MATDLAKFCTKCGEHKPLAEFNRHHLSRDGVRPDCRACQNIRNRAWVKANPARHGANSKRYYENNKEKVRARGIAWNEKHPERAREFQRNAVNRRLATAKGRLESRIRDAVRSGIIHGSKRGRRTFDLLGYSVEDLKRHLERRFSAGMTWDNYGSAWEIDHIIPRSVFNYRTPDDFDFNRAWALCNLQPLWRSDNRRKRAKLTRPFQPSLAMGG